MRLEHQGMSMWHGTPDAPAPTGTVEAGAGITITVGVQPADASNKVELLYRVNRGPTEKVEAAWVRHDSSHKAQYFMARLPPFQPGDTVEYTASCLCAGRQVPSGSKVEQFTSSFQVAQAKAGTLTAPAIAAPPTFNPAAAGGSSGNKITPANGGFIVKGQVIRTDGNPVGAVTVKAVDKDLRSEELLGETTTDSNNHYEIAYTADQFRRAEKQTADLIVRAFDRDGSLLGASDIMFNAQPVATIDLVVAPQPPPPSTRISEYEKLLATLSPLLEGVPFADLTNEDMHFLVAESGVERQRVKFLRGGDQLSRQTGLPTSIFYGFARENLPLDLDALLANTSEALRNALESATAETPPALGADPIIPVRLRESIDAIISRLEQLRIDRGLILLHRITFRLADRDTSKPLPGFTVRVLAIDSAPPLDLGSPVTGRTGLFSISYTAAKEAPVLPRKVQLHVLDPHQQEIFQVEMQVTPDDSTIVEVPIVVPPAPPGPSPTLEGLRTVQPDLPPLLISQLAEHGINTLTDIRRTANLSEVSGLPPTDPALGALEAHASLSTVSSDLALNARLIRKGYKSARAIGDAPKSEFMNAARGQGGDAQALQIHASAVAQSDFLGNIHTAMRVQQADGTEGPYVSTGQPRKCHCDDCEGAASPAAYLADLLSFAARILSDENGAVSLQSLRERLHQPFAGLIASCDASEKRLRQVRICIEVLRSYLAAAKPLPGEKGYREDAYRFLLGRIGTSYDEIRQARMAAPDARQALADRLGIGLGDAKPDHLERLFFDLTNPEALTEQAIETLFGLVDTTRDPLAPGSKPEILTWRLAYLRTQWMAQAWPKLPTDGLPIVDPDVIGPDDFRNPVAKTAGPDRAFDVWLRRRKWVDDRIQELTGITKVVKQQTVPDLAMIFARMYQPFDYRGQKVTPWANTTQPAAFAALAADLDRGVDVEKTRATIAADLNMPVEPFLRLVAISTKDQLAADDPNGTVTAGEWHEVYSILVAAQKSKLASIWITEEAALGVTLGPEEFWQSLGEPRAGEWPPVVSDLRPLVDPGLVSLNDLPEPPAGKTAISLWQARSAQLDQILNAIRIAREQQSFTAMLRLALFNDANAPDPLPDLDSLNADLSSNTPSRVAAATASINNDLRMTVDEFRRLMTNRAAKSLTGSDWKPVYAVLTRVHKEKWEFAQWLQQEHQAGVVYWNALKARLPEWRARADMRVNWEETLSIRSSSPLIDPDLIGPGDLQEPSPGHTAYDIWKARRAFVDQALTDLKAARESEKNDADGLDSIVYTSLGVTSGDLLALDAERANGRNIARRLMQLGISNDAFSLLSQLARLLADKQPVADSDWSSVYSILAQANKLRAFPKWRDEEEKQKLFLDPSYFRLSNASTEVPVWRATREARIRWQADLQTRIDEEQTVRDMLPAAVDACEEATLLPLRDSLLAATFPNENGLENKARRFSAELFIDAEMGSCDKTTRIEQAIETVQGIIFAARTGQTTAVEIDAQYEPRFDEDWQWMGSYSTWRSALLVFLYPENILLPSLRRKDRQTPAFRELLDTLRSNNQLTPADAHAAAARYSVYFRDVCNLTVGATCFGLTSFDGGTQTASTDRKLLYMFGRGPSGTVYWCTYDRLDLSGYGQSFWEAVPRMEGALDVIGAVPYQFAGKRYLCLFGIASQQSQRMLFTKYDLRKRTWDTKPTELSVPPNAGFYTAVVKQTSNDSEPPHIAVRLESRAVCDRRLNGDASGWEDSPWRTIVDTETSVIQGHQGLLAMIGVDEPLGFYLFLSVSWGTQYKYFNPFSVPLYRLNDSTFAPSDHLYTTRRDEAISRGGFQPADLVGYVGSPDAVIQDRKDGTPVYEIYSATADGHVYTTSSDERESYLKQHYEDHGIAAYLRGWITGRVALTHLISQVFDKENHRRHFYTANRDEEKRLVEKEGWFHVSNPIPLGYIIDTRWNQLASDGVAKGNWLGGFSYGSASVYVFWQEFPQKPGGDIQEQGPDQAPVVRYSRLSIGDSHPSITFTNLAGLGRIAPQSGVSDNASVQYLVRQAADNSAAFLLSSLNRDPGKETLVDGLSLPVAPQVDPSTPFEVIEQISETDLQIRASLIRQAFNDLWADPPSNLVYIEEAYYFVPMALALALQQSGQYAAALDWYHTVYDYRASVLGKRLIYYGFELERWLPFTFQRGEDWLRDPLNPHAVAETRAGSYLRFTLLSLIRCFLDYADAEFTRDTAESVARAQMLYNTALSLLDLPNLHQQLGNCAQTIGTLEIDVGEEWQPVFADLKNSLHKIADSAVLQDAATQIQAVLSGNGDLGARFERANAIMQKAREIDTTAHEIGEMLAKRENLLAEADRALRAQPEIDAAALRVGEAAGLDISRSMLQVRGNAVVAFAADAGDAAPAGANGNNALDALPQIVFDKQPGNYVPVVGTFCVQPNPQLSSLRRRAELNLFKLRHCRNIAGLERELDSSTAFISGQLVPAGVTSQMPTPYRYPTLIERAKQLVSHAQQTEASLLSMLERRDAESYTVLKARQDMSIARAGVRLQDLRVIEANDGVAVAKLQQERQNDQVDYYTDLAARGMSDLEKAALVFQGMGVFHLHAGASMRLAGAMITQELSKGLDVGGLGGAVIEVGNALIATSSLLQTMASYERKQHEWEFQKTIALDEARIGAMQTMLATDHLRVAGQERQNAELQAAHAEAVMDFLSNKFTNAELYDWMSGVLRGVYWYFLQQATSMAQAAANQLAFERQSPTPPFVQNDYWYAPAGPGSNADSTTAPNRQGLTGSARLLADIDKLDQYAFETNKRKLQLSKTISLSELAPAEFQLFRGTGVMKFSTPMEMFDRDFPGHYLRLVRRVKTSVLALIPPSSGIRATLATTGASRVVIAGDLFRTVSVHRPPDSIALSAPRDATGLFELDPQSEMLAPFEGLGVDTSWEFRMPKAANLFDYSSIADVLLTIDYTALNSFDYARQVIGSASFTRPLSSDRPFSFRRNLADQWYDLHNPDQTATPMVVRFTTARRDFPPNLDDLRIQQVVLYFSSTSGEISELSVTHLHFTEDRTQNTVGGSAKSMDGVISTRRGNAASWMPMIGKAPFGTWELALANTDEVKALFQNDDIEDILFVITFSGRTPDWPK